MKKALKILGVVVVLVGLAVAAAGIYKFNYLSGKVGYDVDGNPITLPEPTGKPIVYQTNSGETIEVYALGNEGVEVHFMQSGDDYLKAFTAYRTPSASGVQYVSKDERFTFWAKGDEATITSQDNHVVFNGSRLDSAIHN